MAAAKTAWDTVVGTASASIDIVLMQATRPLSGDEILAEVRRLGLPERAHAHPHLATLKKRGYVSNSNGKWFKTIRGAGRAGH